MQDINNIIYVPINTFQYRFWDRSSNMRDDLDGIGVCVASPEADSIEVAKVVTAVLNSDNHDTQDFTVTIPAALLAQQQRTQKIFTYVMVAIAAISLLVGGIGIMNIVLATVLERTREIGIRRSVGARRFDIVRQFLTELVLISAGRRLAGNSVRVLPRVADRKDGRVENDRDHCVRGRRFRGIRSRGSTVRRISGRQSVAN